MERIRRTNLCVVRGINEMVERIEQKEKEVFEASYSLQEAELQQKRALIVSLKKQINVEEFEKIRG